MSTELNGQESNQQEEQTLEQLQEENLRLKKEALQKENELLKAGGNSSGSGNLAEVLTKAMSINSPDHKIQAHGKTVGEMKALKDMQALGKELPMVTASNGKAKIRADEQHLVHVYLETVLYNEKGKKVSPPGRVQKFYVNDFNAMSGGDRNHFGQYDIIDIIHDPRVKEGAKPVAAKKPATEQSVDELRQTYKSLYGEDAPADMPVASIVLAIREAS